MARKKADIQPSTPATLEDRLVADFRDAGFSELVSRRQIERILGVTQVTALNLITDNVFENVSRLRKHYRVPLRSVARYVAMGVSPPKPQ